MKQLNLNIYIQKTIIYKCVKGVMPVYVLNMSGLLKNFTDRFAYVCHIPRFHGKKAWIVCSTGSLGAKLVCKLSSMASISWAFEIGGSIKYYPCFFMIKYKNINTYLKHSHFLW